MATETELRYVVPNRLLFDRLCQVQRLGEFDVQEAKTAKIVDHYQDTRGRALLHQGWACRFREEDNAWIVTLKGPKTVDGSVVVRPEYEIVLPERIDDVSRWPRGDVQARVFELTGGLSLHGLVTVYQRRHRFAVREGLRHVGTLSLDRVIIQAQQLRHRSFMIECELEEDGVVADLHRLDAILTKVFGLIPESRSKLQRALELLERGSSPDQHIAAQVRPASVDTLCQRYDVPLDQAQGLADRARHLFEGLMPEQASRPEKRRLLDAAARLCLVGQGAQHGPGHLVGRDVLIHQPIEKLDENDQIVVAAAAFLRGKRATPERLTVIPENWPMEERMNGLRIAAVVRLATALRRWEDAQASIQSIDRGENVARIILAGPQALAAAERAQDRSDLWSMVSPQRLEWGAREGDSSESPVYPLQARKSLGINPWDSMQEAARKAIAFHYQRMLDHEAGTRLGEDIEELHDMRVAIRRMRSAIRLFAPYLRGDDVLAANDSLRRLGRTLGQVRDMDVALARLQAYADTQPAPVRQGLEPLFDAWQQQRERSQARLLRHLDSTLYASCLRRCNQMLEGLTVEEQWGHGQASVAEVAPRFLYIYWHIVRAYGPVLQSAPVELLHALRIDCKRLRYGIEFFQDILPEKVTRLLPEVIALQDHLGEMHDAAVAMDMIDAFTARPSVSAHPTEIGDYRRACRHVLTRSVQRFPTAWKRFCKAKNEKRFKSLLKLSA